MAVRSRIALMLIRMCVTLLAARATCAAAALPAVTGGHYEGGHRLGTFAVYLTTQAGLPGTRDEFDGAHADAH